MYQPGGAQVQNHHAYRQASPTGPIPTGVPSLGSVPSTGPQWIQLKTYNAGRQLGPPYRGTRFDRATNTWLATVSYNGQEVDISSHDHEGDAALAHDRKVLELHGAEASVNFQYSALVEEGTAKVLRLRAANGKEIPMRTETAAKGFFGASPSQLHNRPSPPLSPRRTSGEGMLGVNRWDGGGRHTSAGAPRLPRAPMMAMAYDDQAESKGWAPRSDRAYTAADHASVANAREHDASLVYEIAFPRPGALGLNLRSYFAEEAAGARPGLAPYGCLEVLDAQSVYLKAVVEPGDLLIAINGQKLTGTKFSFEAALELCSKASLPRVLRFARMAAAAAAEIECALAADVCAVFDAVDSPEKRLVAAQLHSAPPYFHLNPPTRQPAEKPSATT
ncbi:unnamed protein product, partial [Scytosiphon promiscuus]